MQKRGILFSVAALIIFMVGAVSAQTTEITYQGQMQSSSMPATGVFDFEFALFDDALGVGQIGSTNTRSGVAVASGIFSVNLDFGQSFAGGGRRFLEIRVRQAGGGAFTTLSPRQAISSSPYSIKSLIADVAAAATTATNATNAVNAQNAVTFSGTLAGDVTGTQPLTTVARLRGRNVSASLPNNGQVLKFNNATAQWEPANDETATAGSGGTITGVTAGTGLSGGGTLGSVTVAIATGGVGTAQLADGSVTDAKIVAVSGSKVTGSVANATNSTNATNFTGALAGDVTGTQAATSIANNAVTTAKLANASVTDAKIVSVAGSKITGSITTATIPGANVTGAVADATNATNATNFTGTLAGEVTGTQAATTIAANAVTNAKIANNAVTDPKIATGQVVKSINTLRDSVTLAAGANITITPSGQTLTIASTGGGGVTSVTANGPLASSGGATPNISLTGIVPIANGGTGVATGAINNSTTLQTANFNISGNGTTGGTLSGAAVNATTEYRIAGSRILGNAGSNNFFAGVGAGTVNTGSSNSFVGQNAGIANTTGFNNSFVGAGAGNSNTTGSKNSFVGDNAGSANTMGSNNSFVGAAAGQSNTTGGDNSFFGFNAGIFSNGGSNSFFGPGTGDANTTGDDNSFFGRNAGGANTTGGGNSIVGVNAGNANTVGGLNSFFGYQAGFATTTGGNNSFFGNAAGFTNVAGVNNTIVGDRADVGGPNLSFATAIGADAVVGTNNRVQLGRDTFDTVRIGNLGAAVATNLCISNNNVLSACTSSGRYKENIQPLRSSLNLVQKLRPVTFDWKGRDEHDLGLIAEEVAKVDPLLVTHDRSGDVQGVKYDQLSVVLINAIKEQQQQIKALHQQIKEQKAQTDAFRALLCSRNRTAKICRIKK